MAELARIRAGMQVWGANAQEIGTVEAVDDGIRVNGQHIPAGAIDRVDGDRVYLRGPAAQYRPPAAAADDAHQIDFQQPGGGIRVPVVEERLEVERRPADLGEVRIHKTVTEERQSVPVDLRREDVQVERRDVPERPLEPGEAATAFEGGTIRVPVRGEEAVARKEPVVTGEVVVQKEPATERQEVGGTVRRERVEVDEDYGRARAGQQPGQASPPAAAEAPSRPEGAVAEGMDVVGPDGRLIGRVKEARGSEFLLDRRGQRDVYVPVSAIARMAGSAVELTVTADEVETQGWPNPPLF
jgi:uncharacterized protein (TIGR02271 family)